MRLSIILPVYNVEAYIEKCVLSLQNQDIPKTDYEIILINDGSPDNSRQVILKLMKQFKNIVFIDQENKGVSMARNAGIDKAIGKYLLFIDPDDYIETNSLKRVLQTADNNNSDVSFLGYTFLTVNNTIYEEILYDGFSDIVCNGMEAYLLLITKSTVDPDKSVGTLYNRAFMNNAKLRYIANVPYLEDGEFIARILCLAERCVFDGNKFYYRTTRTGSATNSRLFFSERAIQGFILAAGNLKKFSRLHSLSQAQIDSLNQPIAKFTLLSVQSCTGLGNWASIFEVRNKLNALSLNKLQIKAVLEPYLSYAKMYNRSIFVFFVFYIKTLTLTSLRLKYLKLVGKRS